MKISIITPTFNSEKTLKETIESVVGQTYQNIEYIIIDGKSSDTTLSIIKEYSERYKGIIKYISEEDNGIYDAMNKSLNILTGDFFIFLGSDDIFNDKDVLQRISLQLKNKDSVYYGDVLFKNTQKRYIGKITKYKILSFNICHQAIFYPQKLIKKKYDTDYKILADYVYNLELYSTLQKFEYLNEIISIYNEEGISSKVYDIKFVRNKYKIIYKNFGFLTMLYRIFISPIYTKIGKR